MQFLRLFALFLKANWLSYIFVIIFVLLVPIIGMPALFSSDQSQRKIEIVRFYKKYGLTLLFGSVLLLTIFILVFETIAINWSGKLAILGFVSLICWAILKIRRIFKWMIIAFLIYNLYIKNTCKIIFFVYKSNIFTIIIINYIWNIYFKYK